MQERLTLIMALGAIVMGFLLMVGGCSILCDLALKR